MSFIESEAEVSVRGTVYVASGHLQSIAHATCELDGGYLATLGFVGTIGGVVVTDGTVKVSENWSIRNGTVKVSEIWSLRDGTIDVPVVTSITDGTVRVRSGTVGIYPGSSGLWGRCACLGYGTAAQLRGTAASVLSITVKALDTNNASVLVAPGGGSIGLGTFGLPLLNTPESLSIDLDDPSKVWIKGTVSDAVSWFALVK